MSKPTDKLKRQIQRIKYGVDDAAGPVDMNKENEVKQCLSDWKRWASSKDKCPIYINGTQLSKFDPLPVFDKQDTLLNFLKTNLFRPDASDETVKAAMSHFHQGGILNATQLSISNIAGSTRRLNKNLALPGEAEQRIDIKCDETNNIHITETNTYKKYTEGTTNHVRTGSKHPYYAETKTEYLFKPNNDIELTSFKVDCPKSKLKHIFDAPGSKQSILSRIMSIIQNLLKHNSPQKENEPVGEVRIYTSGS